MWRTFNCGIGMVAVIDAKQVDEVVQQLEALGEVPYVIGEIAARGEGEPFIEMVS